MKRALSNDQIAIVGYAHRFPGEELGAFWDLLTQGKDLVTQVDPERWAQETYLHPRQSEPGTAYTFASGTVGDISGFDSLFFGISPREAAQMDPQQRLLLELAWSAFEQGGIKPSLWRGSRCGVFVGISTTDHAYRSIDDLAGIDPTSATGNTMSMASNRLSYFFDLHGPSMSVDTACSSSLVAFHQASQALSQGDAESALVAGVSLHLHPMGFINFSKTSMLSKKGKCTPFDAEGDGYVRSEGAGVVLLKKLSRALEDGDEIFAVVAGSSVNCDGKTSSLTVPSANAQEQLLSELYAKAKIHPEQISYIEAHGTGTAVGDPIETRALGKALGLHRSIPLPIGSVKSNIGHLEAASGMAGLVKALLILQHRLIPPTLHFKTPNPNIHFEEWKLEVVSQNTKLPEAGVLTVGINSFGFGGANAHVILQSPPPKKKKVGAPKIETIPDSATLFLSAKSASAFPEMARDYLTYLQENPEHSFYDVAYSQRVSREWFPERLLVSGNREEVIASLENFISQGEDERIVTGQEIPGTALPIYVFSGNGSQYPGMGRALLQESPVFRKAVEEVDRLFIQYAPFSILEFLEDPARESALERTEIAQPLLFAIQVGLVKMLEDAGVVPGGVLGHSVGEVAAAWVCGALSLEQAVFLIYERSMQQGKTKGSGKMTAVALSAQEIEPLLKQVDASQRPYVAGVNSPRSVTLAGSLEGLSLVESFLREQGARFKRLELDYAFHSPAMDEIKAELLGGLEALEPQKNSIPFYSTVTGKKLSGLKLGDSYWWKNIRNPVAFGEAVCAAIQDKNAVFIEIGPHPVLRSYLLECLKAEDVSGLVTTPMTKTQFTVAQVQNSMFQLLIAGISFEEQRFFPYRSPRHFTLPAYPWQKERFETPTTPEGYQIYQRHKEHPLLGYRLQKNELVWENHLDLSLYEFLADHEVGGTVVFPAAGFLEMALAAGSLSHPGAKIVLENVDIHLPLLLSATQSKTVRFLLNHESGEFSIQSRIRLSTDSWLNHVTGRIIWESSLHFEAAENSALSSSDHSLSGQALYALAAKVGLNYGDAFRSITSVQLGKDRLIAQLSAPPSVEKNLGDYLLHPTFLDGALQSLIALGEYHAEGEAVQAFLPIRTDRIELLKRGCVVSSAEVSIRRKTRRSLLADIFLRGQDGTLIARIQGMRFRAVKLIASASEKARFLTTRLISKPRARVSAAEFLTTEALSREVSKSWTILNISDQKIFERHSLLELLCYAYAREALQKLSESSSKFAPSELMKSGKIASTQRAFFQRLVEMLEIDQSILPIAPDLFEWNQEADHFASDQLWKMLLTDHADEALLIRAIGRIGVHLPEILCGIRKSSELLPRAWSEGFQFQPPGTHHDLHQALLAALEQFVRAESTGCRIRILWMLGASVQSEEFLAPWMKENLCDVVLTVPTQQVLSDLSAKLSSYPSVIVKVLHPDQSESFSEVDFGGKFDLLVLAGEPAHLVESGSFSHLRNLLLPGGALVFAESGGDTRRDFLFGGMEDWWLVTEEKKISSRLMGARLWSDYLIRQGYDKIESFSCFPDTHDQRRGSFLVLAQLPIEITSNNSNTSSNLDEWMIAFDGIVSASLALELASSLEASQQKVHLESFSTPSDARQAEDVQKFWNKAFASNKKSLRGVVFLLGVGELDSDPSHTLATLESRMMALHALLQKIASLNLPLPITVITSGAFPSDQQGSSKKSLTSSLDAGLLGLVRVARNEYSSIPIRLIDIDDLDFSLDERIYGEELAAELLNPDREEEILLRAGVRLAPRLTDAFPFKDQSFDQEQISLDFSQPGSFKNLLWRASSEVTPGEGEVEIEVRATGLNFRDVMYAMGLLPDEALESGFAGQTLGMELSGIVKRVGKGVDRFSSGDEVIAFAPSAFSSSVVTRQEAMMKKPSSWSFEAAATIPTAFFTVYYALHELARVSPGERILIHGAAGGVGIAAIQLAKHFDLEIFATAGSEEKRDFVRQLGADYVLDSRSLSFAEEILTITKGEGIDVVLNSLSGEALSQNLKILRPFGRFLELGKRDFYENSKLGLRPFRNNISFFGIDADQLMAARPELTAQIFARIEALFEEGVFSPLPYTAFDASEVADAFRYMQHSRQIGKVVIRQVRASELPVLSELGGRAVIHENGTYLITGGTSGFGLRTAEWLVERGARWIVLLGRNGRLDDAGKKSVEWMQSQGVTVSVAACDITDRTDLEQQLSSVREWMPPLKGVIHSAVVIEDGLLQNLTSKQLDRVMKPKVLGALLLDELTRHDPIDLFVLYSSATTCFGNPGQGAYVAANSVLESLAYQRRAQGLPATCVAWGAISDVGFLARNPQIKEALSARMGGLPLQSHEALRVLDSLIASDAEPMAWIDLDWSTIRRFLPASDSARFVELRSMEDENDYQSASSLEFREELETLDHAERVAAIILYLKQEISKILRIDQRKIQEKKPLLELGLDSLMGVELLNSLESTLSIKIPMLALSEGPSIAKLADRIAGMILPLGEEKTTEQNLPSMAASEVASLAHQHGVSDISHEVQESVMRKSSYGGNRSASE